MLILHGSLFSLPGTHHAFMFLLAQSTRSYRFWEKDRRDTNESENEEAVGPSKLLLVILPWTVVI
jgi:hypothetical protein